MKRQGYFIPIIILLLLSVTACSKSKEKTVESIPQSITSEPDKPTTSEKVATPTPTETVKDEKASFNNTYWTNTQKIDNYEEGDIELFLYDDGTFNYRILRTGLGFDQYYDHVYADTYTWNLNGSTMELQFKSGAKQIIYSIEVDNDSLTFDDFYLENGCSITLTKEEMPTLPSLEADFNKLAGDWVIVAGESEGYHFLTKEEDVESEIRIYKKNGGLCVDYRYKIGDMDSDELKEVPLKGVEEPIYAYCINDVWCAEFQNETENKESVNPKKDTESIHRAVTLLSDNVLLYQEYISPEEDEPGYMFYGTFLRKGSEEYLHADEFCYRKTVTVSNMQELAEAINSNTHIILKAGTYDLSELSNNIAYSEKFYRGVADGWFIDYVDYLMLEGEENANVKICTPDGYDRVLNINNSGHIVIKNITFGHDVEPGFCDGSVLHLYGCTNVVIDNCNLYGSGTYGIESMDSFKISVTNTNIYECTYGLLSFYNTNDSVIRNCNLYDCIGYEMFIFSYCNNVSVEDCIIRDNKQKVANEFISDYESSNIFFRRCNIINNTCGYFHAGEVLFEDCNYENNTETEAVG